MPASRFAKWARAPESGVTEVTWVTRTSEPSISAGWEIKSKLTDHLNRMVTKVTEPSSTAIPVSPVTQRPDPGLPRKTFPDQGSNPGNPGNLDNGKWPISPSAAAERAWWRELFEKRVAIRGIYCGRTRESAKGLAFGDVTLPGAES